MSLHRCIRFLKKASIDTPTMKLVSLKEWKAMQDTQVQESCTPEDWKNQHVVGPAASSPTPNLPAPSSSGPAAKATQEPSAPGDVGTLARPLRNRGGTRESLLCPTFPHNQTTWVALPQNQRTRAALPQNQRTFLAPACLQMLS